MKKIYISILFIVCISAAVNAQWNTVLPMSATRAEHQSANLPDGSVLVAGGWDYVSNLKTAEIYDPSGNVWYGTSTQMSSAHSSGAAVTLNNGTVLVIGGYTGSTNTTTCDLYNPITDTWTATGSLTTGRSYFTATLLNNGKVLVAGGFNPSAGFQVGAAELYDPTAGTWSSGGTNAIARSYHSAVLLNNGKVLVAGGLGTDLSGLNQLMSAEIYDPALNSWSGAADMNSRRDYFGMTKLQDGTILAAGGRKYISGSSFIGISDAESYNPTTNVWTTVSNLPQRVCYNQLITLGDGMVLSIAGLDSINTNTGLSVKGVTNIYDPTGMFWDAALPNTDGRFEFSAITMADGRALLTGGVDASAEIYSSSVSVPQVKNAQSLVVYPNPAKSQFTVYGLQFTVGAKLEPFNILGKKVYETELQTTNSKQSTTADPSFGGQTVNVSSLKAGVYFLKVHSADQEIVQKLTITN